jgi:hypothetical protein
VTRMRESATTVIASGADGGLVAPVTGRTPSSTSAGAGTAGRPEQTGSGLVSATPPPHSAVTSWTGAARSTRCAFASASRSKRSPGWLSA